MHILLIDRLPQPLLQPLHQIQPVLRYVFLIPRRHFLPKIVNHGVDHISRVPVTLVRVEQRRTQLLELLHHIPTGQFPHQIHLILIRVPILSHVHVDPRIQQLSGYVGQVENRLEDSIRVARVPRVFLGRPGCWLCGRAGPLIVVLNCANSRQPS